MKVYNYGNDYAQSEKFQKEVETNVANPIKSNGGETGGASVEVPKKEGKTDVGESKESGQKKQQGKKEKSGEGSSKK